jgi:uncharacterized protein YkwD
MRRTTLRLIGICSLLTLLSACGGGDGAAPGGTDNGNGNSLSPMPPAASSPVGVAASGADITCDLAAFEADALRLINQRRAAGARCGARGAFGPAGALVAQSQLTQAALGHSRDMADNDYFSHDSRDGRTMADRVSATGYAWRSLGENIAAGHGSVQQTIDGWMGSDSHCANLMNPDFTEYGLACARNDASRYQSYWTLDLGRR